MIVISIRPLSCLNLLWRLRFNYQEERVLISLTGLTPPHLWACTKQGPIFLFLCSMIWGERWLFLLFILAGFVTRVTRLISLEERFTLPQHLSSPPVFSAAHFARSFVFCVLLDRCLSVCPFSFGHCVVCFSSISGFLYYPLVSPYSS